jgi:uncharacterized protein (TIGR03067 family)
MRTILLILVATCLVAADAKEDAKKEMDKLQGTWICTSMEVDGQKKSGEEVQKTRLVFKGNKARHKVGPKEIEMTYTLDPGAKPKRITVQDETQTMKGIYSLEGDSLKICFARGESKDFPSEFAGKKGFNLGAFKREKK